MPYRGLLGRTLRGPNKLHHNRDLMRLCSRLWRRLTALNNECFHKCSYSTVGDGIIRSPYGTMDIPNYKIHECLYENLEKFGNKIAVECGVTERKYTYLELRKASETLAASFQNKLKLNKGDTAAIYLPNMPEYILLFLAGSASGVTLTTINSTYKSAEVSHQILASGAKVIFTSPDLFPVADSALKAAQKNYQIIVIRDKKRSSTPQGTIDFWELLDPSTCGELKEADTTHEDTAILPYSSGTSGLPKGVQLSHRNIVSNILQVSNAQQRLGLDDFPNHVTLGLLPLFHIYGMTAVSFSTLRTGGTLITVPKFDPLGFLSLISNKKVTNLYLVPPLILFLGNYPIVRPMHLKNARLIMNGASPIGLKDMEKLLNKVQKDCILGQGYGMTETSPVVLLTHKERRHKFGSTGVPVISTEVKIVDPESFEPQPPDSVGELWVRGPQVMKGYINNAEANKDVFVDDWIRTGDLAYYDKDGDFYISDRIKELIKVKGFQVAPAELEALLRTHPKIIDAAVIGVPHDTKGEVPKAFVVLKKGSKATEEEIKEFVKSKVASHKALDGGVIFVKEIPKSAAGKILRRLLK